MSYMAGELKHRIHVMQADDVPAPSGLMERRYKRLVTLWSGKKSIGSYLMFIRSVNAEKYSSNAPLSTDEFKVRWSSVVSKLYRTFSSAFEESLDSLEKNGVGRSFDGGYDNNFDSLIDIFPIKTDYFVFLQKGNSDTYRGRLYKINRVIRDDDNEEFIKMQCTEIEEVGLGAIV